ncbi:MAG: TonB-dependent receptor plug domain-containing protein, partial [Waterburya sp.]
MKEIKAMTLPRTLQIASSSRIRSISMWLSLLAIVPISAKSVGAEIVADTHFISPNSKSSQQLFKATKRQVLAKPISPGAKTLLVQRENTNTTKVTGVEINQNNQGLQVILKTATGGKRLVPLILPEGKNLVIDILDATLAFSIRNGVSKINPASGIKAIRLTKVDDRSIRLTITGATQAPRAEIIPSKQNLILSVNTQGTTAEQAPDEEIEIIATGERQAEDDYYVPDAGVTRTDTPIIETPSAVQIVPRQVIEDQGATDFSDALRSSAGVTPSNSSIDNFNNVIIRGFEADSNYLRNGLSEGSTVLQPPRDLNNLERLEILSGPASIVGGQMSPGGIINVVTKQPLSTPLYELSASYGSFNSVEGAFDFSGPLNESKTVAYRLNSSIYHSDTFIDVDDVDIERFSIAPVLSWQIGDQTKISFEGLYLNSRTPQRVGLPAQGTIFNNPNGEIPRDQFVGEPNFDGNDRKFTQIGYDLEHNFSKNWSLRHAFSYFNYQFEQREAFVNTLQDDLRTLERSGDLIKDDIDGYQVTAYATGKFKTGNI